MHLCCAQWIAETQFGNLERKDSIIVFDQQIRYSYEERLKLTCKYCHTKLGACIQCTKRSCKASFHVTCGFIHGVSFQFTGDAIHCSGIVLCEKDKLEYEHAVSHGTPLRIKSMLIFSSKFKKIISQLNFLPKNLQVH